MAGTRGELRRAGARFLERLIHIPDHLRSGLATKENHMRYIVLWALGVPISGLIVLHLLGMI
jgi:hypothetical protein